MGLKILLWPKSGSCIHNHSWTAISTSSHWGMRPHRFCFNGSNNWSFM